MNTDAVNMAGEYMQGCLDETIPACRFIKLACERQRRDLHRVAIGDASFPYYFDEDAAQRVVDFCQILKPSKGEWAGKPLVLLPWQIFFLTTIFGWKRRDDDTRRFRTVYCEIPRKQGKSALLSAIGLYLLCADSEPGAEVFSAATTRDQARQIFSESVAMAEASLKGYIVQHGKKEPSALLHPPSKSKFKPLSADASTLDGL